MIDHSGGVTNQCRSGLERNVRPPDVDRSDRSRMLRPYVVLA